jgi:16S rRNA (guanine966-N2)-methyltransferase
VRIIRGILKSRRFSIPKKFPSRPTTDFAKEGLFNLLENKYSLENLKILDLCAGTGNISFEFVSREAGHVTCIDSDYNCISFIRRTASDFGIESNMDIQKTDIILFLKRTNKKFDIIFADPPYDVKFHDQISSLVFERDLLTEGGVLIIEHGRHTSLDKIPQFDVLRPYGNVYFSFFSAK